MRRRDLLVNSSACLAFPAPAAACLTALMPEVLRMPLSSVLWRLQGGAEGEGEGEIELGRGLKQRPNQSWFSGPLSHFYHFYCFSFEGSG